MFGKYLGKFLKLQPNTEINTILIKMNTPTDFHQLATDGKLNTIDPNLLTQENLTLQDNCGNTPLHYATLNGHLEQIPNPLLTQENLTLKNNKNTTPLHWAAETGQLHLIPIKFLTQNNLT